MDILIGNLSGAERISGELSGNSTLAGEIKAPKQIDRPIYEGAHEVTPSEEIQILETEGKALNENIVINPIPSNYGLITWNGATLTVS